ncbi:FadR/GntR family transcriptional regulator [Streptomyces sp. NBC_01304]|uniref:FadR/GntR family transcriptional regulator n=1 Tax=Streptomyces sp. NBC_01304 TaxID=2903818 RepID=UPI002E11BEB0|nr:FadR family transcriptional regulator [Streptomyces sp. NBC_01304]
MSHARPLVEQTADRLRDRIAAGEWPVGNRLPGETDLAKELGVGRSTVRESLRALTSEGLVQPRQGAGVFVMATEPVADWPTRLRKAAVADVHEVRLLIEVQAAALAAERRTPEDLDALDATLAAGHAAAHGADFALHAAVVRAAHNPVLADLFDELAPVLRQAALDLVDPPAPPTDDPGPAHAALVQAIRDGDATRAGKEVRAELERTLARLRGTGGATEGHLRG